MTTLQLISAQLLVLGIVTAIMLVFYLVSLKIKNAGIVDVVWAASFGIIAVVCAAVMHGLAERNIIMLVAVIPWSTRMTVHLLLRFLHEHPQEDTRYAHLRKEWGNKTLYLMCLVFLFQGLLIAILSAPFIVIAGNPSLEIHFQEWLGAGVCVIGTIGEAIADAQLKAFKGNPANKAKVCSAGLWNYSRHPNYFFEFTVWVGIFILASASPLGIYTIYCPLIMLFLLTQMTGVKISEEQSLKKRGDEYRRYQASTSAFIPWFKKSSPGSQENTL